MTKKEKIIASLIGLAIGSVLGFMMSMSMLRDAEKCRALVEENKMLQEMIMDCQGD